MIAEEPAVKRPDIVRGIVLSNTATKIGQSCIWHNRIEAVKQHGFIALVHSIMERWFCK